MPLRNLAFLVLAAGLLAATAGCQSDVDAKLALAGLSSACRINSDCSAELVCVFVRCHEQCSSSRDCDHDARCVAGQGKRNVCQLAEEAGCSAAGSCPGAQVCGADAACRDACSTDGQCLAEQVCSGGTCADTQELSSSGQLAAAPERPAKAPAPCAFDSDCPGQLVCLAGICGSECQANADCRAGQTCRAGLCRTQVPVLAGCLRNSDCGTDQQCIHGQCQTTPKEPEPECAYDSDCATPGQHCTDGACLCECAADADCGGAQLCAGACQCVAGRVLVGNVNVTNARELAALQDVVEITGELTFNIPGFGEYHLPRLRKAAFIGAFEHKATLVFEALEEVTGINCYQDCRLPSLKHAGALTINSEVIGDVSLPALESAENFNVWYSSQLQRISAPLLKSAKILRLEGNARLRVVDLPKLEALDAVIVGMNDRLPKLSLPRADVATSISIASNPQLLSVELPSVTKLSSSLGIGNNLLLETLDFAGLQEVSDVSFYQMPELSQLDLSSLSQITNNLQFSYGAGPSVLALPMLKQAKALTLFHVARVSSVSAPMVTQLEQFSAYTSPELTEVELPLQTLTLQLYLQDNAALRSARFPNLQQIGSLHVGISPLLTTLEFPALTQANGVFIGGTGISSLDTLNPSISGSLTGAGDFNITANPALPVCAANALGAALTAKGWVGSIYQSSNLECSCNGAVCQ